MKRIAYLALALCCLSACVTVVPSAGGNKELGPVSATSNALGAGALRTTLNTVVLAQGESAELATFLRQADGSLVTERVVWISSDDNVAKVGTITGKVEAGIPGRALLTGSLASDSASRVAIEVSVVEKHAVLQVKVDPPTPTLALQQSIPLKARVTMADGQVNGNVTWSSSDNTIATVNPTTGEVTGLREGRVTIVAAYSADLRYKGLAEIEVTQDAIAGPQPSPSDIIFKPDATPLPVTAAPVTTPAPSETTGPVTQASPNSNSTAGGVTQASAAYKPPNFAAVREFSKDYAKPAIFEFIDFRNVIVAEGTQLTVTSDAGKSWTVYPDVGSQTIRAMHWPSPSEGWVAGDNGTILKVQIQNGQVSFSVKDSGTKSRIEDIHFTSPTAGVYAALPARRTTDGGETWQSIGVNGTTLVPAGMNRVAMLSSTYGGTLYLDRDGAMGAIEAGEATSFNKVRTTGGHAFLQERGYNGKWHTTSDWVNFTPIASDLKTPTQILRDALRDIYPITQDVLLAQVQVNYGTQYVMSRDGGQLWSDPGAVSTRLDFIQPFSETEMWATYRSTLYRAGTP